MRKSTMILGSTCILLTAFAAILWGREDRTGPKIQFPEEAVSYREGMEEEELLRGVTAQDDRDGDVTDSLKIENIYTSEAGEKVIVIYTAKDSGNNVTKKSRELERDTKEAMPDGEEAVPESADEAEGGQDADLPSEIPEEQRTVLEQMAPQRPRLYLNAYEAQLKAGEAFESLSYVDRIEDDSDAPETLWTKIQVNGAVDTNTEGSYTVEYLVNDSDGNPSNTAILTVQVVR